MQQLARTAIRVLRILALMFLAVAGVSDRARSAACTDVVDDLVVTQDTVFCARNYRIMDRAGNGVIIVGADGITLDGSGLTLNGKNSSGYGVRLNGRANVTIRNFNITRFFYAVRIDSAQGVVVENNQLWGNGGPGEQFYDINRPLSVAYGGGLLVNQTSTGRFSGNRGWDQNVGLDLYVGSGNLVAGNDFSDTFGWGMRLYGATQNTLSGNRADHVHGCRGANCSARDTAGLLLVVGSHGNIITGNSLVDGGDGFFIGNENGLPSNDNLVENNDCSAAIHNAIEATFSQGNVFRGNNASNSTFGFWLGFSYASAVEDNRIVNNGADGIHWEHGRFGTVSGNEIRGNSRYGLAFTLNPTHPLIPRYPGSEASHDHAIADNTIVDNASIGVLLLNTTDSQLRGNRLAGNAVNLALQGGSIGNTARDNGLLCRSDSGRVCQFSARNDMPAGNELDAEWNWWGTELGSEIASLVFDGRDDPTKGLIDYDPWQRCGDGPACAGAVCGDGRCDAGEGRCTCPNDCGAPPMMESACSDGIDDDCDGQIDCDDADCAADSACRTCLNSGAVCSADAECCGGKCRGSTGQRRCR